ncbi:M15 family metallopeptidase [Lactococcus termiticola]|uniref:D-alanyl-D-alanine carboxypeptidase n=1 Tax=Lactococcus termiticola TaxID=2169526 RepID=A0A2R5HGN0_9LACT|nr:M15 family metallopeptidase [Lactococcus termiticola]GBG97217.1 D-alanyl-D-alanine carboxypeptidase [Lactococcus termiticola]
MSKHHSKKVKKKPLLLLVLFLFLVAIAIIAFLVWPHPQKQAKKANDTKTEVVLKSAPSSSDDASSEVTSPSSSQDTAETSSDTLPSDVSKDDWDLVLINLKHSQNTDFSFPDGLTTIDNGQQVDSRIASAAEQFLAAARQVNPAEHFVSGYRSYATQVTTFNYWVSTEKAKGLSQAEAEKAAMAYSQPPGSSEHMTGLAFDMSSANSLGQADPSQVAELQKIAAPLGFILRFPYAPGSNDPGSINPSTGIEYEDWHWRYVGPESAKYIYAHPGMTLEEYLDLLT